MDHDTPELERKVAAYLAERPKGYLEMSVRLQEIWGLYPAKLKSSLIKRFRHWYFPELGVPKSAAYTLSVLVNAQRAGYDVTPCWEAWDRGLAPGTLKTLLHQAKQQAGNVPGRAFNEALRTILDAKLPNQGNGMTPTIVEAGRESPSTERETIPAMPAPRTPKSTIPPAPEVRSGLAVLGGRYRRLINMRSAQLEMTQLQFMERLLDRDAEESGMKEVFAREDVQQAPVTTSVRRGRPPGSKTRKRRTRKSRAQPGPAVIVNGVKLPTLTERLKIVMGTDDVGIDEAIKRLRAKGKEWIPNSGDLKGYISLALATHKKDFLRVRRGIYCVLPAGRAAAAEVRARVKRLQDQARGEKMKGSAAA